METFGYEDPCVEQIMRDPTPTGELTPFSPIPRYKLELDRRTDGVVDNDLYCEDIEYNSDKNTSKLNPITQNMTGDPPKPQNNGACEPLKPKTPVNLQNKWMRVLTHQNPTK